MDSIMEDSIFDDFGADSDAFSPDPKPKGKTAPKATTTKKTTEKVKPGPKPGSKKMPTKKPAATTKKAAASKKRAKVDTENEESAEESTFSDEPLLNNTPPKAPAAKKAKTTAKKTAPKALQNVENEAMGLDGTDEPEDKPKIPGNRKQDGDQYQMLSQLQHILIRPDTYIGSVERTEKQMWVFKKGESGKDEGTMEYREVSYVPGLYKIFDEILVNAADNKQRDKNMDEIKVTLDRESGEISVWNNGRGIPIQVHSEHGIWVPEMIFGYLLTSSNYDDEKQKVTGGRNGFGAKLCNIYSTSFTVETADHKTKKKYKQTWTENMTKMGKAKITEHKGDDYTKVTFKPDYSRFGMTGIDDDFEALARRRVYDLAGTSKVAVKLDGKRIPVRNFKKYIEMYTDAIKRERGAEAVNDKSEILVEQPDPRWEVGFAVSDGSFHQVSFVNSIATTTGGTHVNYIADQICNRLAESVKKKNKAGASLKPNQIRNHIFLFVNSLIVNPAFTGQTKEQLTTKPSQFGSKCVVSEDFLKKIEKKTDVLTNILHFAQQKADQILKKSDGGRRSRMNNPKLTDANKAGTKEGHECTLILTEGDSAKGLAMAGRAIVGPDLFGVFPLKGKPLNVRDASIDQIAKNDEIQGIKNFLGLQHKKEYADTKGLRYGHIMIMADQDHDGSHIKGLIINYFHHAFPSLLKLPKFLLEFITPIVKVYKGDPKHPKAFKTFFTMPEYEAWKESHKNERGWEHKYYKGLGTSNAEDAQIYFRDLDKHLKEFDTLQDKDGALVDLAFSKKKADDRKEWLRHYKPGTYLDHSERIITYDNFFNKELIIFSMYDNVRSIPSVVDGFKPAQRKVLFACFKRNLKKDLKVVELAGYVSGTTAYQHGENSLQSTIVGLAQSFVGSNNINCLEPSGNFGSRLQGGSDCASARYIYTRLSPFARRVFNPADEPLLTYNTDDERRIEPEFYVPVIPMALINGADGIGTGWSSNIPNYNPVDIVENLKRLMNDEPLVEMHPWYRGFTGKMEKVQGKDNRYVFHGIIEQTSSTEVEVTELPIKMWTQDFKDRLEDIIKAEKTPSFIKDYKDYNTHLKVNFIIQMDEAHLKKAADEGLEEKFKLTKTVPTSNLVAFNPEGRITKYASVEDILKEFYAVRIKFYVRRKQYMLSQMQKELEKMTNQARFIQMIIDGKLVVSKKKKAVLIAELREKGFKSFPKLSDAFKAGETERAMEDEDEDEEGSDSIGDHGYDYLLGMAIWSLTQERVERLRRQIGDKEKEIDVLIKRTEKDLWRKDLDDFLAEWEFQLEDERQRQRRVANLGRRGSQKLKTGGKLGPGVKPKRKAGDEDDDFEVPTKKKKPAVKKIKPTPGLANHMSAQRRDSITSLSSANGVKSSRPIVLDGGEDSPDEENLAPIFKKGKAAAAKGKAAKDDESSVARPPRQARAVAKKPVKYLSSSSDSEDDDGDKLLGDISSMVKGTSGSGDSEARPLFTESVSRPNSSAGLKASKSFGKIMELSDDETDYSKLVPQPSPQRSVKLSTTNNNVMTEDEDAVISKPSKVTAVKEAKAAAKRAPARKRISKAREVPKAAPEPAKKAQLSPTAKAYAARQKKASRQIIDSEDEIDAMANDILDSDVNNGDSPPLRDLPASRARRATATKKATYAIEDDSMSLGEEPSSDVFSGSE